MIDKATCFVILLFVMSAEEFLAEIEEALELDTTPIRLEDNFREYEEWDSLTFLALVTLMQQEHNLALDLNTFNSVQTWQDLYNMIEH